MQSLKSLQKQLEKLQKAEKHNPFAHLTPDDLINPETYKKIASEIDAGNAEFKDFSNIIDAALMKRGTEDKSYIKKVGDAVRKSFQDAGRGAYNNVLEALKANTQKKTVSTPANYIFKTPEGKYDIDLESAQSSPMAAEPLKYIDISKENAGEIYKKLKIASNTSDSFTVDRLSKEFSKKAPLKDIAESTNINEAKRDIWNATNGLKEYPYSRAELLEHAHLFDEVPSYITMHPETPKEDLINEIKSSDELHKMPEIFSHPNLNPMDIKQALTARDASGKQFPFDAPDMKLGAKNRREIDNNLAALEHLVETSKSHDVTPNFELGGKFSTEDADYAAKKLLELKKKHLNSDLPDRVHDSLNQSILAGTIGEGGLWHWDFDDTNGPLLKRIGSGEFAAKDSKGKIKENKLLDLVLGKFVRSDGDQNPSEHFNQFLHSVIDSKHRPSIVKMAEKMGHTLKKEHLDKMFENGKHAASYVHRLPANMLSSIMANPEYMGKIDPHLTQEQKDKLNKIRYAAMYSKDDAPINFSNNTEILRKFRDVVEANGGTLSAKQLGQFGLNENALKVAHLKDAKGNYTTEAIQKHIDSMPKHTYNFSHTTWSGAQRHTGEKQRVFQLNHTPEMMDELEKAGVLDTFLEASKISKHSGHPVKDNTLGWVRYTKGKDGNIHIDEIQSDLGRGLHGAVRDELDRSDLSPQKREKYAKLFAKEKVDKMSDILFKNQHPSKILHEGFLQFLRNSGHTGKQVHIWQAMPKAKIANQTTEIYIPQDEIPKIKRVGSLVEQNKPIELEDLDFMTNTILSEKESDALYNKHIKEGELNKKAYKQDLINHPWIKHVVNHIKNNQDKIEEAKTKGMSGYRVPLKVEHLPVHMKVGYQDTPPKMGYEQDSYGSIDTQKESDLHNEPTWQAPLRKSFKTLAKEYERLAKANDPSGKPYSEYTLEEINNLVQKAPYSAAEYLRNHKNFNANHIQTIVEKDPSAAAVYLKDHPLLNANHIQTIVQKAPYSAAEYLRNHKNFNANHIQTIVQNKPSAAAEYLRDHHLLNANHIQTIVQNDPYAAAYYLKDHPLLNANHIQTIAEKDPRRAAYYLKDHHLFNTNHIDTIVQKEPERAAIYLHDKLNKQHINYILKKAPEAKRYLKNNPVYQKKYLSKPIFFSSNTEKLRKLRDIAETNNGIIHSKQLAQHGLNENALNITHLKDAKGNYSAQAIQNHIDSLPKHSYYYSNDVWEGAQRHTDKPQNVFQLNITPEIIEKLQNEGVLDTFKEVHNILYSSGHPVHKNTLGWVRYNKAGNEYHIDEIQTDLSHNNLKKLPAVVDSLHSNQKIDDNKKNELLQLFTSDKLKKMHNILFSNQVPSKLIHEAFLQHMRNKGKVGSSVHIWQAEPKAKLAGQDISEELPVHMKVGYDEVPPKMGYEAGYYGNIKPQTNPDMHREPTWQAPLRKSFKTLLSEYEELQKAVKRYETWYPEDSDPDGMPHPEDPTKIKHTAANKKAVWKHIPQIADSHDEKLKEAIMYGHSPSSIQHPKAKQLFRKLMQQVHADPDRHVIGSGTSVDKPSTFKELRTRHLLSALSEKEGYETTPVMTNGKITGIQITAPRHSKNVNQPLEFTKWTFDGKDLSSEDIKPMSQRGGRYG